MNRKYPFIFPHIKYDNPSSFNKHIKIKHKLQLQAAMVASLMKTNNSHCTSYDNHFNIKISQ